MSLVDTIAKNGFLKNVLFGQLKNVFKEGNVAFIVVRLDPEGEIVVDLYEHGEATIVANPNSETLKIVDHENV